MDKVSNISHVYLTGGGLKGLCYLGIIRYMYLENMTKNIKHIVGTSIGAYFGLILGLKIPIEYIEDEIGRIVITLKDHLTIDHHNLPNLFNKNGIFRYDTFFTPIIEFLRKEYDIYDLTFMEFAKKTGVNLYVNAINVNTAKKVIFSTENTPNVSVLDAVKASMSVPFLYEPVLIDGEYYMDVIVSDFEIFSNVNKNSKLILMIQVENNDEDAHIYAKGHEFSFLEHFLRVNEIVIDLINNIPDDSEFVYNIRGLAYDKFLKFAYTDKSIYVDIDKKDMDDMIVQQFVEFSLYMKKRYPMLE